MCIRDSWYSERMGLIELEDFLSVASDNIDFVKITTTQVLGHPEKWLKSKLALYKKFSVKTYLDHGFFKRALKKGIVDEAIEAGANLGFSAIEFMDTFGDIPDWQNKAWRQRAINCGLDIIFEYHPESGWRNIQQAAPSNAKQIIKVASPFLEHGAITLLIDHEEIELQNDAANDVLCEVMEYFGKESVAFEVTSPKEAEMTWYSNVIDYFNNFGTDCNITNIMPSQVMLINLLRSGERPANLLKKHGIEYVEFRGLDINPFEVTGISKAQIHLMDIFLLYCLMTPSPKILPEEAQIISENSIVVIEEGRNKNAEIFFEGNVHKITDAVDIIFSRLILIARELGGESAKSLDTYIQNKRNGQTLPEIIMKELQDSEKDFHEYNLDNSLDIAKKDDLYNSRIQFIFYDGPIFMGESRKGFEADLSFSQPAPLLCPQVFQN